MAKIDLEKFICSMFKSFNETFGKDAVQFIPTYKGWTDALKDQGLEYKDGQIVEIEYHCTGIGTQEEEGVLKEMIDKPFEIKAGQWYMCIRNFNDAFDNRVFTEGAMYKSTKNGTLIPDNSNCPYRICVPNHYFRPATEDEIPHKEPKFKVGDWVVHDMSDGRKVIRQIIDMTNKSYILDGKDFNAFYFNDLENDYRLWTIQDAKDGDVLAAENGWICIFKSIDGDTFSSYCFMDKTRWFCEDGSECHTLDEKFIEAYNSRLYPATQEQRDLLVQKMVEAGYIWDSKNKQLLKKPEPVNIPGKTIVPMPDLDNTNGTTKFEIGDFVVSTKNPSVKYHIIGAGINEHCERDYVCEDISGGEFNGKIRTITASELEEWAELIHDEPEHPGDGLPIIEPEELTEFEKKILSDSTFSRQDVKKEAKILLSKIIKEIISSIDDI